MLQVKKVLDTPTLDSRDVAKMLGKKHSELLKDVRRYIEYLTEGNFPPSDFFFESQYKDTSGKRNKNYKISKKGCEFLAHKLTGSKGAIFTATYINKFDEMEKELKEQKQLVEPRQLSIYEAPTELIDAIKAHKNMLSLILDSDKPMKSWRKSLSTIEKFLIDLRELVVN